MCLACSMVCCASDEFEGCGCVHCDNPDCWAEPDENRDEERDEEDDFFDALPLAACPCASAPTRFRCEEIRSC